VNGEPVEIELPGIRIAGRRWGDPDGPRVLATHGWLDNAATWDRVAPGLPDHCLLAIDLPGHGHSRHRGADSTYLFVDFVADVAHVAEALGWRRFSLLGHSLGAGIASILAGTRPELIERLLLVEGLGPLAETPEGTPARLAQALAREQERRNPPRTHASIDDAATKLAEVTGMRPDSARILVERGTVSTPDGVSWRADPRLRLPSRVRFTEEQVLAFLRRIACPTLLVRARSGWPFDPATMSARVQAVADLRVVELDGGHHLHLDAPDPLIDELRRALPSRSTVP
jgi:pimeloyl-ACP methyl ester carboxylesterase